MRLSRITAYACMLSLVIGCGSESTQDKMLRMAQERSAAVKRQQEREKEAEAKRQASQPEAAQTKQDSSTNQQTDEQSSGETVAGAEPTASEQATAVDKGSEVNQPPEADSKLASRKKPRRRDDDDDDEPQEPAPDPNEVPARERVVEFSDDGGALAYSGTSGTIAIFDTATQRLRRQVYNPSLKPLSLQLDSQGELMMVGGKDGYLKTFSIGSVHRFDKYQQLRRMRRDATPPRKAHEADVTAVAINAAVELAVSGDTTGKFRLWRGVDESGQEIKQDDGVVITQLLRPKQAGPQQTGPEQTGTAQTGTAQTGALLGISQQRSFHWQHIGSEPRSGPFDGIEFENEVTAIAMAPGMTGLVVGDATGRVTSWTLDGDRPLVKRSFRAHRVPIVELGFGKDGQTLLTVSQTGDVGSWRYPIEEPVRFATVEPSSLLVTSPDGALVGLSSLNRNFDLYAAASGSAVRRHTVSSGELTAADFSPDGSWIALGNSEGRVYFQDDARKTFAYVGLDDSAVVQIARSTGNENRFAFITASGKTGVADFAGKPTSPISVRGEVAGVSPDGTSIVIARGDHLHLVSTADAAVVASTKIDQAPVTAIWVGKNQALLGTESGSLCGWNYSERGTAPIAIGLNLHASPVRAITANDERTVLSVDAQGKVLVTTLAAAGDVNSGSQSAEEPISFSDRPTALHAANGVLFATIGSKVETFRSGEKSTKRFALSQQEGLHASLPALAYHDASKRLAACDDSGRLIISDASTDSSHTVSLPIKQVTGLVWSDDGAHLAATDGKRLVTINAQAAAVESQSVLNVPAAKLLSWSHDKLWFLDTAASLCCMQPPRIRWHAELEQEGSAVAWSDAADIVAAISRAGTVVKYEPASGQELTRVATGHTESRALTAIHGTRDFAFLASNADVMICREEGQVDRSAISSAIGLKQLKSSSDGSYLYTLNATGGLVAWNRQDPTSTSSIPNELPGDLLGCLGKDRLVVAGGQSSEATVLPLSQQSRFATRLGSAPSASIQLASDGSFCAVSNAGESIQILPLDGGEAKVLKEDGLRLGPIAINHDATHLASLATNDDGEAMLMLWEIASGRVTTRCNVSNHGKSLHFSDDGNRLAVRFEDGHCEIFAVDSLSPLDSTPARPGLESVVFSEDGQALILSDQNGSVVSEPLLEVGEVQTDQNGIVALEILEGESTRIVCGSRNGHVSVWNADDLSGPICQLEGIAGPLVTCRLSPDHELLCGVYEDPDNTICIWKMDKAFESEEPQKPWMVINAASRIRNAAFSSDGRLLFVGATNGTLYTWHVADNRLVSTFARHRGPVLAVCPANQPGMVLSAGEDARICSSQLPEILPSADDEVHREVMREVMSIVDLSPPRDLINNEADPYDAAREALVSGATTSDVIDMIGGDQDQATEAKRLISQIATMESGTNLNPAELSQMRRQLAQLQRRMAPDANARSLASFADGFSNLTFSADTNFKFHQDDEFRPIQLLFSDRFLYAARTSANDSKQRRRPGTPITDEGDNGALLSWDFRYTRLQAHEWSLENMMVHELFPLPNASGVFTVPQMILFNHNGSSRELPVAASWAYSDFPESSRQFIAVGSASSLRSEGDILKVFDVADLAEESVAPLSQYRGYEGIVTAMAFANHSSNIAFCVRGRAVHRLFIADAETLTLHKVEEVDHESPWVKYDNDEDRMVHTKAAPGITSLAFSPDDKVLVAHGQYDNSLYKFSQWNVQWGEDGRVSRVRKSSKELESDTGPLIEESGSKSIWFVESPPRQKEEPKEDSEYPMLYQGSQYRLLVRARDGFMVVNLNSNREEQKLEFPTTQHQTPLYFITDDGRWLIMGDDNGLAYIWDVAEGDRYSVTVDPEIDAVLKDRKRGLSNVPERPAHTGPIAGVALSPPDPGRDYPAYAATFGEENKVKVWELYPILDPQSGLRSRNVTRYPVSRQASK